MIAAVDTLSLSLTQPAPLSLTLDSLTNEMLDKQMGRSPSGAGGILPYQYSLNGAATQASTFTSLIPGPYQVTLTDDSSCVTVIDDV